MSGTLAAFQDAFLEALLAPADDTPDAFDALCRQPGFAVYRNTVMKSCVDALQGNYPAVLRLVGEEWFRAVAALYVREHPPGDARLLIYGGHFPDFLKTFAGSADLPYLNGVAQLDRFWTEAHVASDAQTLEPSAIASLPLEELGALILTPHPAARWLWHDDLPLYTLWWRNRDAQELSYFDEMNWAGEGVLITRPAGQVQWTALDAAGCAFMDACRAGQPLALAASAALVCKPHTDLTSLMATLLQAGAFRFSDAVNTPS